MLTTEENELLTRVGPGTPAGELLRRYWHPVGMLPNLTEGTPTKHVRLLGEDLVLFRDRSGRVGLLADHCSHRGASLLYGRVEERGIACAYHGWLYDTAGHCLETPAELPDSNFYLTVKHRAYPVQEYCGLYWGYLGPLPAPTLPRYDITEDYPIKSVGEMAELTCNWLQFVEQNVDQVHAFILHQDVGSNMDKGKDDPTLNTTRGQIDQLVSLVYTEAPFGIKRRQIRVNGYDETNLIVFPSAHRIYNQLSIKVPLDDTHTRQYHIEVAPPDGPDEHSGLNGSNRDIRYVADNGAAEGKSPPQAAHPFARYRMDRLRFQDFMALETPGPIFDRRGEHLSTSDAGVALLRTMLKREIEKVQQGLDPLGVIRDPNQEPIDTCMQSYAEVIRQFPRTGRALSRGGAG
ncbi:MAG: Rieske (2Fe-2S) domain protein [Chloroflexi bacterium]|nr:Rieske (2Fe-2S) domain protein [Chloroflexota bacterium]